MFSVLTELDPVLLRQFMDEGVMPNFLKLSRQGGMASLATTNPPKVQWPGPLLVLGCSKRKNGRSPLIAADAYTRSLELEPK